MPSLLTVLLFLHISAAIVAFGPSYSFPLTMRMVAKEPEHRTFASRLNLAISERITFPLAIFMGITGVLMIFVGSIPVTLWLQISIVLYLGLLAYTFFVQLPLARRVLARTADGRNQMASVPGARPVGAPAGPTPEVAAMAKRLRMGSQIMGVVILVIVALMVWKPTL